MINERRRNLRYAENELHGETISQMQITWQETEVGQIDKDQKMIRSEIIRKTASADRKIKES